MTYAAYLRIYEPVAAFHEPECSKWAAYAASAARPRRRDSLAFEHAEGPQRAITAPQIVVPDQESDQSAAEIATAIDGVTKGERELALAMYKRVQGRWRAFAEYEMANRVSGRPGGYFPGTISETGAMRL